MTGELDSSTPNRSWASSSTRGGRGAWRVLFVTHRRELAAACRPPVRLVDGRIEPGMTVAGRHRAGVGQRIIYRTAAGRRARPRGDQRSTVAAGQQPRHHRSERVREVHAPGADRRPRPSDAPGGSSSGVHDLPSLPERAGLACDAGSSGWCSRPDDLRPYLTAVENVGLQLALSGEPDDHGRSVALLTAARPGRPRRQAARPAVGRAATAGGGRSGAGPPAPGGPGRRAHRLAGRRELGRPDRPAAGRPTGRRAPR